MRRAFIVLILFACAACSSTTDTGGDASVKGTWSYTGKQQQPQLNIAGTLTIDQQTGSSFSGSAQFSETDLQGTMRTRVGQVNGRVMQGDVVDFDIFVESTTRRHVAEIVGDSMSGNWAVTGAAGSVNTFTARRIR